MSDEDEESELDELLLWSLLLLLLGSLLLLLSSGTADELLLGSSTEEGPERLDESDCDEASLTPSEELLLIPAGLWLEELDPLEGSLTSLRSLESDDAEDDEDEEEDEFGILEDQMGEELEEELELRSLELDELRLDNDGGDGSELEDEEESSDELLERSLPLLSLEASDSDSPLL